MKLHVVCVVCIVLMQHVSDNVLVKKKSTLFCLAPLGACCVCACCHILFGLFCPYAEGCPPCLTDCLTAWLVGPHQPHRALCSVDSPIEFLLGSSAGENENISTHLLYP
jgi:hypothetical protein